MTPEDIRAISDKLTEGIKNSDHIERSGILCMAAIAGILTELTAQVAEIKELIKNETNS